LSGVTAAVGLLTRMKEGTLAELACELERHVVAIRLLSLPIRFGSHTLTRMYIMHYWLKLFRVELELQSS